MTKEVLQQALDYLDQHASSSSIPVRNAIKAALAKPEQWTPKDTAYRSGGLAQFDATLIREGTMPDHIAGAGKKVDHFADAGKPMQPEPTKRASLWDAPSCLNNNDKAMWSIGWNECLDARGSHSDV